MIKYSGFEMFVFGDKVILKGGNVVLTFKSVEDMIRKLS